MMKEITWNNMNETTFAENYYFLVLVFKKNHVFIEEEEPFRRSYYSWRRNRLDCVDKDDIENLVDLPILVFINEECEDRNENIRWTLCDKC